MASDLAGNLGRRELLVRTVPACAMVCLGLDRLPSFPAAGREPGQQDLHKFDATQDMALSARQRVQMQYSNLIEFIRSLQDGMSEEELIRLLNNYSAGVGRRTGEQQAEQSSDRSFQTFVATFRPPRYATTLTHEIVEDGEKVFELRVTECVWAAVFRAAGMGGEIGHAAICNMDYHWPPAFNPDFKMERTKTLMQGHDCCNHRYIDTS